MKLDLCSLLSLPATGLLLFADSTHYQVDDPTQMWLLIAPLAALQLGLMIFALLDWARRSHTRYLDRWVWLVIIIVFSLVGPVAYFFLGREEE